METVPVDPKTALVTQLVSMNLPVDKLNSILLDERPDWAYRNMYTYAGANVIIQASLDARPALYDFHSIANMWLILCPIIIAAFFIASHVLRYGPWIKQRFRAIRKEERIIAVFHVVFTVSFAIRIVPQTIWTIHLLYGPSFAQQFNNNYKRLYVCAITDAIMYTAEEYPSIGNAEIIAYVAAVRSVVRVNPFLVAHHILFFVFFMVPVVRDDVWGQKLILMLDAFIVLSELPLYIALLAHRFFISTHKVKFVTYFCCAWSVCVRIMELVVLISYFAGTYHRMQLWNDMQMWGWFLALSIPGGAVVCCFSLGIFWWFLVKRDRNPEKYGPGRFGIGLPQVTSAQSFASNDGVRNGVHDVHSVPPKLDP